MLANPPGNADTANRNNCCDGNNNNNADNNDVNTGGGNRCRGRTNAAEGDGGGRMGFAASVLNLLTAVIRCFRAAFDVPMADDG